MLRYVFLFLLLIASACQQASSNSANPTPIPFPTMTVGRTVYGVLPTVNALTLDGSGLANPATAVALANRPTATPDYADCPPPSDIRLSSQPDNVGDAASAIAGFLSGGGDVARLERALRDDWGLLGEQGYIRADVDMTGEGQPEVIASYITPDGFGTLLVLSCVQGQYDLLYQSIASSSIAPQLVYSADMNFNQLADLVFAFQQCDDSDACIYQTQLITWKPDLGRFINLLTSAINSDELPEIRDVDSDQVAEIVVRLRKRGNARTGPLRTGVNIYDWNGVLYTLSITQLDPPRFTIQVVHEADRALERRDTDNAAAMYALALDDPALEPWYNDDPVILSSYVMYRLLLTYAYAEDEGLLDIYQRITEGYPDPDNRPIYATLSDVFWNGLQVTNNLHSACLDVLDIVSERPEALDLINRYGSRSPTYTAQDVCPF